MTRIIRILLLAVIWLSLWSDVSVANTLSGLLVATGIVVIFGTWQTGSVVIRPIRAARFALYLLYKLGESSVVVARAIVSPRSAVHTGIVAVPLQSCSDAVATLIADAISLTPGTLTLEVQVEPLTLYVHALDLRDVDQVQADVRTLEVLAVRAFGTTEAIAGLIADDARIWRAR